jgi:D-inositol-3-phosphate glycosyltransferase
MPAIRNPQSAIQTIVLLSPAHPLRGGIAAFTERFAMELQQEGYEVIIYSFSLQYPGFLFPGTTQFSSDPAPPGLTIRTCINSVNPLNWLKIGLELRRLHPDLIVPRYWLPFMGPCLGSILRLAKGNGHTKVVAIADNVLPHEKRPGDRLFTRWFINACDAFVVMSQSVLDDLRLFTQKPPKGQAAACIPHPIYDNYGDKSPRETALAQLGLPVAMRYLLFFGFIRDYKGLDLLLEAMADERIRKMNLHLIVAGEYYGNREKYESQIRDLGIESQLVMRTDYIPNEAVKHYFGAADLVVQPYRTATQSGISQMAYHFEKPMVVTDVGGLAEIVPHGKAGYVVPVEPTAIADAIVDFFENDRARAFSEGVAEGKKRFSWAAMVEGVLKLAV